MTHFQIWTLKYRDSTQNSRGGGRSFKCSLGQQWYIKLLKLVERNDLNLPFVPVTQGLNLHALGTTSLAGYCPRLDFPNAAQAGHVVDNLKALLVPGAAGSDHTAAPKSWDIEKAPTQVQLIELLQTIATREYIKAGFKLAIVVSAYDLHRSTYPEPGDFVAKELPMLDHFLRSNSDLFHMATFGVSAQGGVYALPMLLPEMLKHFKELAEALTNPSGEIQSWIAKAIAPSTIEALRSPDNEEQAKELLVKDLNLLLGRQDFYDASRFAAINLKAEKKSLLEDFLEKEVQDSTEVKMLNRKLLEDVFQGTFPPNGSIEKNTRSCWACRRPSVSSSVARRSRMSTIRSLGVISPGFSDA